MQTPGDIDTASRVLEHPAAAGVAGAVVGLRFAPGTTWVERAINVASGSAIAGYVGPFAASVLELQSPQAQAAIGFGLGLFGISLATAVMDAVRGLKLGDILAEWLRRR